jgi:DeoR family transcriptional regulator of aga operon
VGVERDESETLPATVRRQRMLALIEERGFARVSELGEAFRVSEVTVRSDLDVLEQHRALRRVHGGAMPRHASAVRELPFEEAMQASAEEKRAIAQEAASLVEPGMSVLLDVGTTTAAVARALVDRDALRDITVITNGLSIALELEHAIPRFQVVVTGGTLRPLQHSLVAPLASVMFEHVHADIAFIGCNGVDAVGGVTNVNLPEAELKRSMVAAASRAVVVADGSKIGSVRLGRIGPIDRFDLVITGSSAASEPLAELRAHGADIRVVAR